MSLIQTVTANYMAQFDGDDSYSVLVPFSQSDRDIINAEFASYGISSVSNFYGFKRRISTVYMDYTAPGGSNTHCAIVVPVSGCAGTNERWFSGDYTLVNSSTVNGINFFKVVWNSPPVQEDSVEISTQPTLCRVDMPHGSTHTPGIYRVTCSFRFTGNETFDTLFPLLPTP